MRLLLAAVLLAACGAAPEPKPVEPPEPNPRIELASSPARPSPRLSTSLREILACIRSYEGDYGSVSPSGKYRGAYQADEDFWLTYGGDSAYVDPDRWEEAPRWMQDQVAARGYRARGLAPWPTPAKYC